MFKNNKITKQKIGILTFHFSYNYGAMLQTYALQHIISANKNVDCEIISFEPEELFWDKLSIRHFVRSNSKNIIKKVKSFLYGMYTWYKGKYYLRKKNYTHFQNLLKKSKKFYFKSELENNLRYDKIIVGSDQVWRGRGKGQCRSAYFLDFCDEKTKKYSYAASCGNVFYTGDLTFIKDYLKEFEFVSVREKALSMQLNSCGISNRIDLDPTLLLCKQDYINIEKRVNIKNDFVFVYLCYDEDKESILKYLSDNLKMEIVVGPYVDFTGKVDFKYNKLDYIGPREFLYCIHYAKFVLTSSFHCTVFSILYETPFLILPKVVGGFERIKNLLLMTGLENHIFSSIDKIDFSCDYTNAIKVIKEKQNESLSYIDKIINSK